MVVGNLERFNLVSVGGQTLWTLGSTWFVGLVFLPIQLHSFQSRWHKPLHVFLDWGSHKPPNLGKLVPSTHLL